MLKLRAMTKDEEEYCYSGVEEADRPLEIGEYGPLTIIRGKGV